MSQFNATAQGPGEIAGPAVRLDVELVNTSTRAISVADVVVNMQDAKGTPFVPNTSPPVVAFTGSIAPAHSAQAVYVFELPAGFSLPVTATVTYSSTAPTAVFTGPIP